MTSLPLTINIAAPAPVQPPAQNAAASSSQNQSAQQSQFDSHVQNSSAPAPQPQGRNNAPANTNGSNNNGGDTHFSKLLSAKQGGDTHASANASNNVSAPQAAATVDASAYTNNDPANNSCDAAGTPADTTPSTNATSADTAAIVALIVQLQAKQTSSANAESAQASTDAANAQNAASSPTQDTASQTSLDDLLKELTTLLQQALSQQNAAPSAATPATAQDATTSAGTVKSTDDKKQTDTPQSLSALIQALLQQIHQTTAQPAPTATDATDATAAIGDSNSANSNSALADALNKLAALLDQRGQGAAQSAAQGSGQSADDQYTADQGNDKPVAPASADAQNAVLVDNNKTQVKPLANVAVTDTTNPQPAPDKHALEQAVQNVIDALTSKDSSPKQDTKIDTTASAPANTATAPVAAPAPQAPQTADFAKQLQQAAPQASVPDQVLVHIKNAVGDSSSSITVQLHPEDLGKVDVQMNTSADGKTTVTVTSDNRQTLAMLQSEARSLQDALRDIGLKTDAGGLNFNLRDSGQDARNSSKQQQGGYTNVAAVGEVEDTGFSTTGSLYRMSVVQQGLDIHV